MPAAVKALGDPHLTNIHNDHFDLLQPGTHLLLQVPHRRDCQQPLLWIEADANYLWRPCKELFFRRLRMRGAAIPGGALLSFSSNKTETNNLLVNGRPVTTAARLRQVIPRSRLRTNKRGRMTRAVLMLGPITLEVAWKHNIRSDEGYLNFVAWNLGRSGLSVGGLLGSDDHAQASTAPSECIGSGRRGVVRTQLISVDGVQGSIAMASVEPPSAMAVWWEPSTEKGETAWDDTEEVRLWESFKARARRG